MIIVRLRGGLGNQLFQYAAAYALASHYGAELKGDAYTYSKHKYRKLELKKFRIGYKEASRKEVHQFTGSNPLVRYFNKQENYLRCPMVFAQPHYHFYEDFFQLPSSIYLSGYFQSEKYFKTVEDEIRKMYLLNDTWDTQNEDIILRMKETTSVAIHVRKGDYSSNTSYASFFGQLDDNYYKSAISRMKEKFHQPQFFFFSDNIEMCRKTFSYVEHATFVSHNQGDNSFKDLLLMSSCHHQIIANSTFSWWAAWLNSSSDKLVIAPKRWFNKEYSTLRLPVYPARLYNTKDLIPPDWVKL